MKRALAVLVAAGVLAGGAAPAQAASPLEHKLAAVQRQMTGLRKQVASLNKQVKKLKKQQSDTDLLALEGAVVAYCDAAITADAFQTTWQVINQVGNKSVLLPVIQSLDDQDLCSRGLRVARQPTLVPPTISPFSQMLARLVPQTTPFPQPFWLWGRWWGPGY